jgi:hypothetical protein
VLHGVLENVISQKKRFKVNFQIFKVKTNWNKAAEDIGFEN